MRNSTKALVAAIASSAALGCAVPRATLVVDRATATQLAARYPSRVQVLRIEKAPSNEERLTVHVRYRDGDVIPGEGVVRKGASEEMIGGGVVVGLIGGGLLAGSIAELSSCEPNATSGGIVPNLGPGLCRSGWGMAAAFSGVVALGGLALLIYGATPSHLTVEKAPTVAFTPIVHQNGGGATLQLRF